MTNFIPIFPLEIVVFPGEKLNLHIFEERYKQLIKECIADQKPFGIPAVIDKKISETGTVVYIKKVVKQYDDGRLDITTIGGGLFRILEFIPSIPDKLFGGAIATFLENTEIHIPHIIKKILPSLLELHQLLEVEKKFGDEENLTSYQIGHHAGLDIQQEYELLTLLQEDQRLEYIKRHLAQVVPILSTMQDLKNRIQLNGHFKELKGFDFDGLE